MFQLTPTAAGHLTDARRNQGLPDSYGVRVSSASTGDGRMALQIGFAEAPVPGDAVNDQHGTQVFIAAELTEVLADAELDVETDPTGEHQLVLRGQPDAE